jgi:hypothetical protein
LTVPQFATDGTWHVTDLTLSDTVNNIVEYPSPTAFPNNGNVTTTLGVTDVTADINPPAVADNGIAISLTPVDLSEGPQQVTFDLHLTDDNSGVVPGGSFTLKSPTGVVQTIQLNNLATGSPSDGRSMRSTLLMPPATPPTSCRYPPPTRSPSKTASHPRRALQLQ